MPETTLYTIAIAGFHDDSAKQKTTQYIISLYGEEVGAPLAAKLDYLPMVLTESADFEQAQWFVSALEDLGAKIRVSPPLTKEGQAIPVSAPVSPKCSNHSELDSDAKCARCGKNFCSLCLTEHNGAKYCMPCLSRARSESPGAVATAPRQEATLPSTMGAGEVPWENRETIGYKQALIETFKKVMFSPVSFFDGMPRVGGQKEPLIFALIFATAGAWAAMFWELMSARHFPWILFFWALFVPLFALILIYIGSGLIYLSSRFVGGKGSFEGTLRVGAYSNAPAILQLIPVIGGAAAFIYSFVLTFIGLKSVHELSTKMTIVAILIPLIVSCFAIGVPLLILMYIRDPYMFHF